MLSKIAKIAPIFCSQILIQHIHKFFLFQFVYLQIHLIQIQIQRFSCLFYNNSQRTFENKYPDLANAINKNCINTYFPICQALKSINESTNSTYLCSRTSNFHDHPRSTCNPPDCAPFSKLIFYNGSSQIPPSPLCSRRQPRERT